MPEIEESESWEEFCYRTRNLVLTGYNSETLEKPGLWSVHVAYAVDHFGEKVRRASPPSIFRD